jgi:hypothetical protein
MTASTPVVGAAPGSLADLRELLDERRSAAAVRGGRQERLIDLWIRKLAA